MPSFMWPESRKGEFFVTPFHADVQEASEDMSPTIRVECDLNKCTYYSTRPGDKACYCKHPEKRRYLSHEVCPLYRADWQKSSDDVADLRKRFGIGGSK